MPGRVARVKLSPEQVARLEAGGTISVRLPKDVALLKISLVDGDPFAEVWSVFNKFWDEFDKAWKRVRLHK